MLNVLLCFFCFLSSLHHNFFGVNLPFSSLVVVVVVVVVVILAILLRKKLTLKLSSITFSMDDLTVED